MRREAVEWFEQAESDLRNARLLFQHEAFDLVAFLSHQVAEKCMKALFYTEKKSEAPKTHSLSELGEKLGGCPKEVMESLKELTPHYIVSRYPDASNGIPAKLYTKKVAEGCLCNTEKVFGWAKKKLGR